MYIKACGSAVIPHKEGKIEMFHLIKIDFKIPVINIKFVPPWSNRNGNLQHAYPGGSPDAWDWILTEEMDPLPFSVQGVVLVFAKLLLEFDLV